MKTTTRQYRHGTITWIASDIGVGKMLDLYGEYFEGEVSIFRSLIKMSDTVVSAGGNIGVHLIPLSRMAKKVITFEPQAEVREILKQNLAVNDCGNVDVYPQALGENTGKAYLPFIDYDMPNNFGGMELHASPNVEVQQTTVKLFTVEAEVIPLDSLNLTELHFLMLDIEGFELQALKGAKETIMRHRPYLYIEIDREHVREELLHYIKDELKYELLYHTPLAFNPDNFAGNKTNVFGNIVSIMCLGIPV